MYSSYSDNFDFSFLKSNNILSHLEAELSCRKSNIMLKSNNITQSQPCFLPDTAFLVAQNARIGKSPQWNTSRDMAYENNNSLAMPDSCQNINFYVDSLPSPPGDNISIVNSSPCSSTNPMDWARNIKQEYLILPPSPPESDGSFESDLDGAVTVKNEAESESCVGANYFLENSFDHMENEKSTKNIRMQDHTHLRERLSDTSFQKRHNLKPIALESLFGGVWNLRGDIEPVISMALEQARCDIKATCSKLNISPDPTKWTTDQVKYWLKSTIEQFKIHPIPNIEHLFFENGEELVGLSEEEFMQKCPEAGSILHGQLEIWLMSCTDESVLDSEREDHCLQCFSPIEGLASAELAEKLEMDIIQSSEVEGICSPAPLVPDVNAVLDSSPTCETILPKASPVTKPSRQNSTHIHLWQFLKELLSQPQMYGTALRWVDRKQGVFKIEDSVRVARLWGRRKNRPAMNYDKLSRSIRQYYKKGIMKKTERSQRLVYQFCHPYFL